LVSTKSTVQVFVQVTQPKAYILDIITSINSRRDIVRNKIVLETKLGLGDRETASVDLS